MYRNASLYNKYRYDQHIGDFWFSSVSEVGAAQRNVLTKVPTLSKINQVIDRFESIVYQRNLPTFTYETYPVNESTVTEISLIKFDTATIEQWVADGKSQASLLAVTKDNITSSTDVLLNLQNNEDTQNANSPYLEYTENGFTFILFPDTTGSISLTNSFASERRWLVALDAPIKPVKISNHGTNQLNVMLAGVNFKVIDFGLIEFTENPYRLFPTGKFLILTGEKLTYNLMNYVLKTEGLSHKNSVENIVAYKRLNQNFASFERMCAEILGLAVTNKSGTLGQVVQKTPTTILYIFDTFVEEVPYPHIKLTPGNFYPAGTIIGGMKLDGAFKQSDWWTNYNWSEGGIPMEGLTGIPDLFCPVNYVAVDLVNGTFPLIGEQSQQNLFWNRVTRNQSLLGKSFKDDVLVPYLGATTNINPADFFFSHLWANRVAFLYVDTQLILPERLDYLNKVANDEKPIDTVLITNNSETPIFLRA